MLKPVRFLSLDLVNFRNHARTTLVLEPRHIVLTGPNGAGKTNLLEALSLFAPGRGLRRAAWRDISAKDANTGFAVSARIACGGDEVQAGTGLGETAGDGGAARIVRLNGTTQKSADAFNDICRITWLTPAMDGIFTGPAADRRRMLDRMVLALDPRHGAHALAFEKSMQGRNRLFADDVHDAAWFSAIEQEMAAHGAAITLARLACVTALNAMADDALAGSAFPAAGLELAGEMEDLAADHVAQGSQDTLAEAYRALLARMRNTDRQAGRALVGPHRSDLVVTHTAKAMPAALSSTGEQKALLTGMVLFHAELIARASGMTAVLLLDEVGAHFDEGRRGQLFDILDALGGQAVMTGTEAGLFAALSGRAQHFTVQDGQAREARL
jgi:DNA replication and repair protein RecF